KLIPAEKGILLCMIMFLSAFAGAYVYYQGAVAPGLLPANGGCPSPYVPIGGVCKTDPFTVIWDGQVPGSLTTFSPGYSSTVVVNDCSDGGGGPVCSAPGILDTTGDFLMAHVSCNGRSGGSFTVTDSQANVWHQL